MTKTRDAALPAGQARSQLLADIGRDHFLNGRSKVQIAGDYGLSRFQVANFIQEALDRGIVRISIHLPDAEADASLAAALGITRVVTVGTGTGTASREDLARATADAIVRTVAPGDTVGISWSRTLQATIRQLPAMPTCAFVQLSGAIATQGDAEGPRLLAALQARAVWPLWAPLVVNDAVALRSSPEIQSTLEHAHGLDVAVIAVGRWKEGLSTVWDRVPPASRSAASRAGAVAEISGRLLDAQGQAVVSPVENMIVAATLEQMAGARHTIAVSHGAERAAAVLAAVRGGLVDTLVCDLSLHEALADLIAKDSPAPAERDAGGHVP
ncbi:Cro/Cl family transcriptional regulator [Arthrobacter sp. I2-34]|uniref:Cro/Cl family transcriptional regulator n=1 Tax=Arthrobacter hankyongi TaxID=2904801 RepID=A0ABS9LAL7_9MICC|nr:sugar-binding domain-containing protein [Arthrobacter hankyongi]MCG2623710.1 Cro/Cl family transcriptional regulator [Arthrobacter hankyongi]